MLILLLLSAFEAYRIQQRSSAVNQEIYRRYARQQDSLFRVRRILYLGGIYARDLFMSRLEDPVTEYKKQLVALEADTTETVNLLDQMPPLGDDTSELRKRTEEYLKLLWTIVGWSPEQRQQKGFDFIQNELVPRRNTAGELVRNWLTLSERALQESERNFSETRSAAGHRLLLILGLCLLVGGLVARFGLKYSDNLERETARQFEEVMRAKFELQQLSARLLEIQEDERKRLSRELHDEIGQTLTALRIEISHAHTLVAQNAAGARERLDRARDLAERSVRTVRDISLLLRPSLLDDLGLSPALQSLTEDFTSRTGIPCDTHEHGLEEALPEVLKTCVYRVVQEALNNIQKHAAAKSVRIEVRQTAAELTVRITDDGRGSNGAGAVGINGGRLGILGMRERASMLGGSLTFQSAPGAGSTVELRLPLEQAAEQAPAFNEVQV
jgi:signal transduction histidine kinase